jgi:hypothetical protein
MFSFFLINYSSLYVLSCRHKLNTSNVQTRLVNVRTTQKSLHNQNRPTLTPRTSCMDHDTTTLNNVFR